MKHLLSFELKKITRSLYFIVMIMLLMVVVSFYFIYSYLNTERVNDYVYHNEVIKSNSQMSIDQLSETGDDNAQNSEEIKFFMNEIEELDMLSEAARNHDWETIINNEMAVAGDFVKQSPSQAEENVYTWPTYFTYEVVYEKNKWLLEHHIRPVFPIHINSEITAYDRVFNTSKHEEIANDFYNKHDSSSIYFLNLLIEISLNLGGAIFLLFLFGNIITKEGLDRSGPLNLLDTQPLKRWEIMFSKFCTTILLTFCILAGVLIFGMFLGIVFDRFGDWNYPVLIYESDFSFRFMEMGNFVLLSLLLFFIVMIFCYSWLFLYSVLVKHAFMTIALTILTLVAGVQLSGADIAMEQDAAPFNPFNYFNINDIINMETALTTDNYNFTMWNGGLSLVISSIILLIVSYFIFRRNAI